MRISGLPVREIKAGDDMFFTRAMAEVLEEQGYLEDALMIYNLLLSSDPENRALKERIEALRGLAAAGKRGKKAVLKKR